MLKAIKLISAYSVSFALLATLSACSEKVGNKVLKPFPALLADGPDGSAANGGAPAPVTGVPNPSALPPATNQPPIYGPGTGGGVNGVGNIPGGGVPGAAGGVGVGAGGAPLECGVNAYCDKGGGQVLWPAGVNGGYFGPGIIGSCMAALPGIGINPAGPFQIAVREINNLSVLTGGIITDMSKGPTLVIINMMNFLGVVEMALLNPLGLYCINGLSVLQQVNVTTCGQSNVAFGNGLQILSGNNLNIIPCL